MSNGDISTRHVSRRLDTSRTSSNVYSLACTSEHKTEFPARQLLPLARCLSIQFQSLPSELQPIGIDHSLVFPTQNQLLSVHPHNHGPMVRYSAASDLASQCKPGSFGGLSPVVGLRHSGNQATTRDSTLCHESLFSRTWRYHRKARRRTVQDRGSLSTGQVDIRTHVWFFSICRHCGKNVSRIIIVYSCSSGGCNR